MISLKWIPMFTCSRGAYQLFGKYSYILYKKDNLMFKLASCTALPPQLLWLSVRRAGSHGPRRSQCACAASAACAVCVRTHARFVGQELFSGQWHPSPYTPKCGPLKAGTTILTKRWK